MFRLALDAGHYLKTAGRRVSKKFDKNQTREWVLNDRVARYVAEFAKEYAGVEVKRVDDSTGKTSVGLQARCDRANDWEADFYLSVHHNAGIFGGKGGGIVAFSYKKSTKNSAVYRDAIYDACIAAGGLKGNRATPKNTANFHVLKYSKMPAVLMEYGFMDSQTDAPVILTDAYAKKVAEATMQAIAKVAGLKKKTAQETVSVTLPVMEKGAKGETVRAMQNLLITGGISCGEKGADGSFGGDTQRAVKSLQKKNALPQTGICSLAEWKLLLGG